MLANIRSGWRRTTQGEFTAPPLLLSGWGYTETAGASSVVLALYDGTSNAGVKLTPSITVAAGQSVGEDFVHPVKVESGHLFLEKSGSGTAEVIVRGA